MKACWIQRIKQTDLKDVFEAIGCTLRGGRWDPCPNGGESCSKSSKTGKRDTRGALRANAHKWTCSRCHVGGDAADVIAFHLCESDTKHLSNEEHKRCEIWCRERGLLVDAPRHGAIDAPDVARRRATSKPLQDYLPTPSDIAHEEARATLGRRAGGLLDIQGAACVLRACSALHDGRAAFTVYQSLGPNKEGKPQRGIKQPSKWGQGVVGEVGDGTWKAFGLMLSRVGELVEAKGLRPIGCHVLHSDGLDWNEANPAHVTQLVFDCDGRDGWLRALELVKRTELAFVLSASCSYRGEVEPTGWHLHIPLAEPFETSEGKGRWRRIYAALCGWLSGVLELDANDLETRKKCLHDPGLDPTLGRQTHRLIYLGTRHDESTPALPVEWSDGLALDWRKVEDALGLEVEAIDELAARLAAWPKAGQLVELSSVLEFVDDPRLGKGARSLRLVGELPAKIGAFPRCSAYLPLVDEFGVLRSFAGVHGANIKLPEHPCSNLFLDTGTQLLSIDPSLERRR